LLFLVAVVVFTFDGRRFTWATILRIRVEVPEKLKKYEFNTITILQINIFNKK
jgi:hypothetical protein